MISLASHELPLPMAPKTTGTSSRTSMMKYSVMDMLTSNMKECRFQRQGSSTSAGKVGKAACFTFVFI